MKTRRTWPSLAFVLSVVLHLILFAVAKGMPSTIQSSQSSHSQSVTLKLIDKPYSQNTAQIQSQTANSATSDLGLVNKSQQDQLQSVEVDSGSKISRENSFADVLEAAQEVASDPVMTTNDGIESGISPESSPQGDSESVLNKLAEPCRTIALPLQWTRLKGFWPRRYKAEFRIMRDRSGNSLNLTRMVPEAPASPALDARIFKSFSECVQEQTDKLNIAVLRYSGALTPEPGEAYSVLMEFSPGDTRVASQQGI